MQSVLKTSWIVSTSDSSFPFLFSIRYLSLSIPFNDSVLVKIIMMLKPMDSPQSSSFLTKRGTCYSKHDGLPGPRQSLIISLSEHRFLCFPPVLLVIPHQPSFDDSSSLPEPLRVVLSQRSALSPIVFFTSTHFLVIPSAL